MAKMGRPRAAERMVSINVAMPRRLKIELVAEARRRRDSLSPFCRMVLEEGWALYKKIGWEKFDRLIRSKVDVALAEEEKGA